MVQIPGDLKYIFNFDHLFPAPFLSVDSIMAVLEPLPWRIVGGYLGIRLSELDAIDINYTTDEEKKKSCDKILAFEGSLCKQT